MTPTRQPHWATRGLHAFLLARSGYVPAVTIGTAGTPVPFTVTGASTLAAANAASLGATAPGSVAATTLAVTGASTLAALNATSIGATTPGTGVFTTFSSTSAATFSGTGTLFTGAIPVPATSGVYVGTNSGFPDVLLSNQVAGTNLKNWDNYADNGGTLAQRGHGGLTASGFFDADLMNAPAAQAIAERVYADRYAQVRSSAPEFP